MSKRISNIGLFIILFVVIVGCSKSSENHSGMHMLNDDSLTPVIVELSISPDQAKVNENVMIEALVTQNDKKVTDADKVIIELAASTANGRHEELSAAHAGDGKYVLETSFDQADTYTITSHVTVGPMHTMPKKDIVITE